MEEQSKNQTNSSTSPRQGEEETLPPTYETASSSSHIQLEIQPCFDEQQPTVYYEKLPPYEVAANLPTYEDTQLLKEEEARDEAIELFFGTASSKDEVYVDGIAVGTDCMFIFAFILSFFFNWLGFFIGYCIMMNLAGRYGAISGFGLSVINWLLYMKYASKEETNMTEERLLMWWFFLVLAALLTLKGIINWAKARKLLDLTPEQRQNGRVMILY